MYSIKGFSLIASFLLAVLLFVFLINTKPALAYYGGPIPQQVINDLHAKAGQLWGNGNWPCDRITRDYRGYVAHCYNDTNGLFERSGVRGDVHLQFGDIYQHWKDIGGVPGYPLTDETDNADGIGRYNTYENGVIYWTRVTGAHWVHGTIVTTWGSEYSSSSYPVSDEIDNGGKLPFQGRFQCFLKNIREWHAATNVVDVQPYTASPWICPTPFTNVFDYCNLTHNYEFLLCPSGSVAPSGSVSMYSVTFDPGATSVGIHWHGFPDGFPDGNSLGTDDYWGNYNIRYGFLGDESHWQQLGFGNDVHDVAIHNLVPHVGYGIILEAEKNGSWTKWTAPVIFTT